ncbi:LTA synthase family protein [Sphingomonas parva]|uniref:LTA synthase family protein n=1 Tax=Sphingomonas parva TaxID=2555898 RepID=UPI001430A1E8|nr:LTA synthase family protein [Sphingomonas parva]
MLQVAEDRRGADHFETAWRLAAAGWIGCALLQLLLYLRPSPYGGPFLLQWKTFIIRPLVYELLAVWLLAGPFLLLWLLLRDRPLRSPWWRAGDWLLVALLSANLLITAFDHELYRFLGLRLGPNFLAVYADPSTLADGLFLNILVRDRGGPLLSPLICVAAPLLYLLWAIRLVRRRLPRRRRPLGFGAAILVLPLATGAIGYSLAHAKFRLSRLEPALFAAIRDFSWRYQDDRLPGDPQALARAWQSEWFAGSEDRGWRFVDPEHPFLRVPERPSVPAAADKWNVIIIQLEAVRGVDTGHLRPDRAPSATPYLDWLAARPETASWSRGLSFGPPSINGRFATQCSITPSSRRFITSQTRATFYCLPDALRRQGYRAEMFSAGDIDMDNSTVWVQRMYDQLWRYPALGQRDREIFREAAARIRRLGRDGPFLATLISASNHHPFRSLEPRLDLNRGDRADQRILNTTRYTDDVVRELIEGLRREPWFGRTLFVINSDHGYNLGEHGGQVGAYSLYHESTWIPFLIVGNHPRLPKGRHDRLASLLDVAPTIADLIGLREANPWQGHSLLSAAAQRRLLFAFRDTAAAEIPGWSAVSDPQDGRPRLYAGSDWLERRDLAARQGGLARTLLEEADRRRRFNDYIIRHGKVWPAARR